MAIALLLKTPPTVLPDPPGAPTGLVAAASDQTVTLTWSPNGETSLQGYNVYRNAVKVNANVITLTRYIDSGLTNDVRYTYSIKAVNAAGESASSSSVNAVPFAVQQGTKIWPGDSWASTKDVNWVGRTPPVLDETLRGDGSFVDPPGAVWDEPYGMWWEQAEGDKVITVIADHADDGSAQVDGWIDYVEFWCEGRIVRRYSDTTKTFRGKTWRRAPDKSPRTGAIGWSITLSASDFQGDGVVDLYARVVPVNGREKLLPALRIFANPKGTLNPGIPGGAQNALRPYRTVKSSGGDYTTVREAVYGAPDGAVIYVFPNYGVESGTNISWNLAANTARTVVVRPAPGYTQADVVISRAYRTCKFPWQVMRRLVTFQDITFDMDTVTMFQSGSFSLSTDPVYPTVKRFARMNNTLIRCKLASSLIGANAPYGIERHDVYCTVIWNSNATAVYESALCECDVNYYTTAGVNFYRGTYLHGSVDCITWGNIYGNTQPGLCLGVRIRMDGTCRPRFHGTTNIGIERLKVATPPVASADGIRFTVTNEDGSAPTWVGANTTSGQTVYVISSADTSLNGKLLYGPNQYYILNDAATNTLRVKATELDALKLQVGDLVVACSWAHADAGQQLYGAGPYMDIFYQNCRIESPIGSQPIFWHTGFETSYTGGTAPWLGTYTYQYLDSGTATCTIDANRIVTCQTPHGAVEGYCFQYKSGTAFTNSYLVDEVLDAYRLRVGPKLTLPTIDAANAVQWRIAKVPVFTPRVGNPTILDFDLPHHIGWVNSHVQIHGGPSAGERRRVVEIISATAVRVADAFATAGSHAMVCTYPDLGCSYQNCLLIAPVQNRDNLGNTASQIRSATVANCTYRQIAHLGSKFTVAVEPIWSPEQQYDPFLWTDSIFDVLPVPAVPFPGNTGEDCSDMTNCHIVVNYTGQKPATVTTGQPHGFNYVDDISLPADQQLLASVVNGVGPYAPAPYANSPIFGRTVPRLPWDMNGVPYPVDANGLSPIGPVGS